MESIDSNEKNSGLDDGDHPSSEVTAEAPQASKAMIIASMGGIHQDVETTLVDHAVRFADWTTGFLNCTLARPPVPPAIVAASLEATSLDKTKEKTTSSAFASNDDNIKPAAAVVDGRLDIISDDDEATPAIPRRSVDVWGEDNDDVPTLPGVHEEIGIDEKLAAKIEHATPHRDMKSTGKSELSESDNNGPTLPGVHEEIGTDEKLAAKIEHSTPHQDTSASPANAMSMSHQGASTPYVHSVQNVLSAYGSSGSHNNSAPPMSASAEPFAGGSTVNIPLTSSPNHSAGYIEPTTTSDPFRTSSEEPKFFEVTATLVTSNSDLGKEQHQELSLPIYDAILIPERHSSNRWRNMVALFLFGFLVVVASIGIAIVIIIFKR